MLLSSLSSWNLFNSGWGFGVESQGDRVLRGGGLADHVRFSMKVGNLFEGPQLGVARELPQGRLLQLSMGWGVGEELTKS